MAQATLTGITAGVNDGPAGVLAAYNANVEAINDNFDELYPFLPEVVSLVKDWGTINAGVTAKQEVAVLNGADGGGVVLGWTGEPLPDGIIAMGYHDQANAVQVHLFNPTAGNIAVGTRTCNIFIIPAPVIP